MATTKRPAKKSAAKPTRKPPKHVPTPGLYSWITHTEFASSDRARALKKLAALWAEIEARAGPVVARHPRPALLRGE